MSVHPLSAFVLLCTSLCWATQRGQSEYAPLWPCGRTRRTYMNRTSRDSHLYPYPVTLLLSVRTPLSTDLNYGSAKYANDETPGQERTGKLVDYRVPTVQRPGTSRLHADATRHVNRQSPDASSGSRETGRERRNDHENGSVRLRRTDTLPCCPGCTRAHKVGFGSSVDVRGPDGEEEAGAGGKGRKRSGRRSTLASAPLLTAVTGGSLVQ
ncbi:uncharacterized protein C8Q71DRAFT_551450 [Rhodofomes roseus]|uniref:Secreted protein n=1 Tax=Rhodofomes roseus TaxID=34475 RepID=A0ABQ8KID2_9APHY|nr:uncharacterized protein C8Q71DRAFT_551450 [Rhodofomes roseus]KAH9837595.1 hypothetical protein C8Q71DRAFT_551450 [Rhodofomes roseus]